MQVELTKGEDQLGSPELWLDFKLKKKELEAIQEYLGLVDIALYDDPATQKVIHELHKKIKEVTGVK